LAHMEKLAQLPIFREDWRKRSSPITASG
jgi:hypothetical protein